jgi:NAD(P)-dependent dehydrogenase (short-subunit alcohol dehydrogenase family)
MREFSGKVAVVTGAASGMGRAFAERFAREGMCVVLADIEESALDRAVTELRQQERIVLGVVANTMSRESVARLAERVIAEFGDVHLLCNNAGVISTNVKPIWAVPDADWQWVMGVNFWGVLNGIQAFVPRMLAHGQEGHIVNTASLAGLLPGGTVGVYGVSKHAVLALSEALYEDLHRQGSRLSASVLCPGMVHTRIHEAERNRPADFATGEQSTPDIFAPAVQGGMEPAAVAELVYESVRDDRFYILPHPDYDPVVLARVEHVLARGAPFQMNPAGATGD